MLRHRVLVSAHRCGYAELGTVGGHEDPIAGIAHSARIGADYCEFDVRRCSDGTFVVSHDADGGSGDETLQLHELSGERACQIPGVVRLDVLVDALAATGYSGHVTFEYFHPFPHYPEALIHQTSDSLDRILGRKA